MIIFSYFNSISKRSIIHLGVFEVNWMLLMPTPLPI